MKNKFYLAIKDSVFNSDAFQSKLNNHLNLFLSNDPVKYGIWNILESKLVRFNRNKFLNLKSNIDLIPGIKILKYNAVQKNMFQNQEDALSFLKPLRDHSPET